MSILRRIIFGPEKPYDRIVKSIYNDVKWSFDYSKLKPSDVIGEILSFSYETDKGMINITSCDDGHGRFSIGDETFWAYTDYDYLLHMKFFDFFLTKHQERIDERVKISNKKQRDETKKRVSNIEKKLGL